MTQRKNYAAWIAAGLVLAAVPFVDRDPYHLHILILILIWSFAYTSWSMMGRFGLTSLGHGGFMGVGAYVTALLWNHVGLSLWLGIPIALVCAGALALVVAYPCFRFRITGHYFALVTLALSRIMLRSTQRHSSKPTAQTASAMRYQVVLWENCNATRWLPLVASGV